MVCERWVERHILRERTSSSISSSRSQAVPTLAPPCKLVRDVSDRLRVPRSRVFSALCLNLTTWFLSRGLLPVTHLWYPSALIALLFTYHNVTAFQSTQSHHKRTENPWHMLYSKKPYLTSARNIAR